MYLDGFTTERLIIRRLSERDIPVWTDFFLDQSYFDYIGLDTGTDACDHSKTWIKRQLKRYEDNEYGLLALIEKSTMEMIGQCGLITMNVENSRELEVGYHIISRYKGRGYATEAAKFFMDWVFENDLADLFIALIHVDNIDSQSVAKKLGLRREKETTCMKKPAYRYVISRDEWLHQQR
jgi:RimJ/RimL family protein N-acetyltransferase